MSELAAVVGDEADCIVRGTVLVFVGLVEKGQFVMGEDGVQMPAG